MLAAAPLLPVALSAAAQAQQADQPAPTFSLPPAGSPPAPNPNRQGPELDVYRDSPTPRATTSAPPPAVTPTIAPPPVAAQPAQPIPTRPAPTRSTPTQPGPDQPRDTRPADRPATTPAPEASARQNEAAPAPVAPLPEPPPPPVANAAEPAPATAPTAPDDKPEASVLPWIIGGALALLALAAVLLLRRRRPVEESRPEPLPATAPDVPASPPPAPPAPPSPVQPPLAPAAAPPSPAPGAERPWLDMDMAVTQARFSLLGVTIAYSLILHNRGERPAQDVLVRGVIGNAGAQQQALLQGFFGGDDGMPLHHSVAIEPGETRTLTGELRLAADAIQPVQMGQRSLLIPIAAFDVAYRWGGEGDDPAGHYPAGQGRTARAFIVGQEQEPPTDRLAPLRLDQGPRQYRRPAARAAVELTPA